jgi:hypothetical protein
MSISTPDPHEFPSAIQNRKTPLVQLGGGLGVAACLIGMAICVVLCAGLNGVLILSIVPAVLGVGGFIVSVVGAVAQGDVRAADATVVAAILVNVLAMVLAGILVWVWTM